MKYRLLIVFVPTRLIFQSFVGLVLPTDLCTEKHDYVAQFPGQNRRGSSLGVFYSVRRIMKRLDKREWENEVL